MAEYKIAWEIDVDAESEMEAARFARDVQLDPWSEALFFTVTDSSGRSTQIQLINVPSDEELH